MLNSFRIPSYAATTLLTTLVLPSGNETLRASKGVSPKVATNTVVRQYPAIVPLGVDTYVVLEGAANAFSPVLMAAVSGSYSRAIVLEGQAVLIPVNYTSAGTNTIPITDGVNPVSLTVTSGTSLSVAGSFSISANYHNYLCIIGGSKVLITGTGMNSVASIVDSDSNVIDFTIVDDTHLVFTTKAFSAVGSKTYTFKNAAAATLGTQALTFASDNTVEGDAFFWQDANDIITVDYIADYDYAMVAWDTTPYYSFASFNSNITAASSAQYFTRIVRDRNGIVIPYASYEIKNIYGVQAFRGEANNDGVIQLACSLLPNPFMFVLDRTDVPLRAETISY